MQGQNEREDNREGGDHTVDNGGVRVIDNGGGNAQRSASVIA